MSDPLAGLLKTHFGFDRFLPGQEEIIRHVLTGRDALVLMPTGGGKSLCFQLPALFSDGITLVISPLIALMKDQVDGLKANGVQAEFINSSLGYDEIDQIKSRLRRREVKLLYVAPERLAIEEFREFLREFSIRLIAVDEAHCISHWGHDFRPEYLNLKDLRNDFPAATMLALTATATPQVRLDIVDQLQLKSPRTFLSSFDRPNLFYDIRPKANPLQELLVLLSATANKDRAVIIYCFSRKGTEELAAALRERGFKAEAYHAGLESSVRHEIQDRFLNDETPIIAATIAFGMGIDKSDIRLVVHYDLPRSIEGYYQETGRAGRDGLPAACVLFYSSADRFKQEYFIKQVEDVGQRNQALDKLAKLTSLCERSLCRRKFLLEYFGEYMEADNCGRCDCCTRSGEEFDAGDIARTILECVGETGGRFGTGHLIDVLRGSRNAKVCQMGHDRVPSYGKGAAFNAAQLKEIIGLLIEKKLLLKSTGEYPVVGVTKAGGEFLKDQQPLLLPALRSASKKGKEIPGEAQDDANFDPGLFEELRFLRKQFAQSRGVPPFVVFADKALMEMAAQIPQDPESFLNITGVGQQKLALFGPAFMKKISEYCRDHGLSSRAPREFSKAPAPPDNSITLTFEETRRLLERKFTLEEIAKTRGITVGTVLTHVERLVNGEPRLELAHLKPAEPRFAIIRTAFERSGGFMLAPVKDQLDETFTYEELRLARIFLIRKD